MTVELARGKVYVVDRGREKLRGGQGLLAGLDVVIRHFTSALTKKIENPSETSGVFTVEYPEERLALPEAFRNFPVLLYDDKTGQELCTSCFQCERICPPQVIHISQATDPNTGKPVPAAAEFVIEYDACMSCGLCHEVCPFDAIKMDHEFELSTADHPSMTVDKEALNRPVSYYEAIAPTMWAEVKDGAYKKLQGNAKRRPGTIGIAPQMIDKVGKPAPAVAKPAASPAPAAARPAAPVAPAGANMSEDKAARLAAIRAANATKSGDAAAPAPAQSAAPVAAVGANMPEDKAARLAAIRAANAAKSGGAAPPAPPTPTAPAAPAPVAVADDTGPTPAEAPARAPIGAAPPSGGLPFGPDEGLLGGVPANTAMPEDKLERLKAIRSGNLAKRG